MKKLGRREQQSPGPSAGSSEVRCECHRLLAQYQDGVIVLRCPRCKKQAVLSVTDASSPREIKVEFVS